MPLFVLFVGALAIDLEDLGLSLVDNELIGVN
jgi:hypothetical protein